MYNLPVAPSNTGAGGISLPTQRFLKLSEQKRARVTEAVVCELARVPFDMVSINRIIQNADISRGSFYQYFTDKDDMLDYVLSSYHSALFETVKQVFEQSDGDVFQVLGQMLRFTISYGTTELNRDFCRNVFRHISRGDINAFEPLRVETRRFMQGFLHDADLSDFRDRSEHGLELAFDILAALLRYAIFQAFMDLDRVPQVLDDFEKILELAKYGLLKVKNVND